MLFFLFPAQRRTLNFQLSAHKLLIVASDSEARLKHFGFLTELASRRQSQLCFLYIYISNMFEIQ